MTATIVNVESFSGGVPGNEVYEIPNPATAPGQLVLVFIEVTDDGNEGNFGNTVITPVDPGWQVSEQTTSVWVLIGGFGKFSEAGDPAVWQFSLTSPSDPLAGASGFSSGVAVAIENANSITWSAGRRSVSTSAPTHSLDVRPGELLLYCAGGRVTSGAHVFSPPSGMTEIGDDFTLTPGEQGTFVHAAAEDVIVGGTVSRTGTRSPSGETITMLAAVGVRSGWYIGSIAMR